MESPLSSRACVSARMIIGFGHSLFAIAAHLLLKEEGTSWQGRFSFPPCQNGAFGGFCSACRGLARSPRRAPGRAPRGGPGYAEVLLCGSLCLKAHRRSAPDEQLTFPKKHVHDSTSLLVADAEIVTLAAARALVAL